MTQDYARLIEASPFDRYYGLEIVEASDQLVRGRVRVLDELKQPTGVVHGGV
jgi:acyl-coenzyme A thioesterase PaaI-like protein